MKEKVLCPHCGAKMMKYRHGLTVPLVTGLRALFRAGGGPINLKQLGLTRNQWDNFQKLRYWHLVFQVEVDGKRKKGVWQITTLGRDFLYGEVALSNHIWTYRGETCERPDDDSPAKLVRIRDIVDWYEKREDYAAKARPLGDDDDDNPLDLLFA